MTQSRSRQMGDVWGMAEMSVEALSAGGRSSVAAPVWATRAPENTHVRVPGTPGGRCSWDAMVVAETVEAYALVHPTSQGGVWT